MKSILAVSIATVVFGAAGFAQMVRKPTAEHANLETFVGRWTIEAQEEGLSYTINEVCEWFEGGFHLICRGEGGGVMSALRGQTILGFDTRDNTYTRYSYNSFGNAVFMRGRVSGAVHTWDGEITVNGQAIKLRSTVTVQSPSAYSYRVEGSFGDGAWQTVEEGKGTRTQ